MKRKLICLIAAFCLTCGMSHAVYAEDFTGSPDWTVTFNGKKMESNFSSSQLAEEVYQIQPGDTMTVQINLKNSGEKAADWYMTNEIIRSFEDSQEAAQGGAYAYTLIYSDHRGEETVLYMSESVGGEGSAGGKEGLYQAADSLSEYFFLDSLTTGQSGVVRLTVGLDGETQGNAYQNTLAQLQMNFAVELNTAGTDTPNTNPGTRGNIVRTGDEMTLTPFIIVACVTGTLLLLFAFYAQREREKERRKARGGAVKYEDQ